MTPLLYPDIFRSLESVRWNLETDVPWNDFDAGKLSEEQAQTIKMNAITEWSALPATEMFLRDNRGDSTSPLSCQCGFSRSRSTRWF